MEYLKKVDKGILQMIYDVFCRFKGTLELDETLLEKIAEILSQKNKTNEKIIVHPFLCDLFEEKVYRMKLYPTVEIIVPLWHHELVYDVVRKDATKDEVKDETNHTEEGISSGCRSEVIVECFPILPENVSIDEKNNLHIVLKYKVEDIWKMDTIVFEVGGKIFSIHRKELYMTEIQCKVLPEKGIPCINNENMYDVSKKSDVYVYIQVND